MEKESSWRELFLLMSGFVPLLGLSSRPPDLMLLIYSIFVVLRVSRAWWSPRLPGLAKSTLPALVLCFLVSGILTEFLAWVSNYLKAVREPALFHPQLIADWIVGLGFYSGWAVAWWLSLRRFHFKLWEAFVITGLQGIFFEQLGAVFIEMIRQSVRHPALAVLMGLYVFVVHGSAAALALTPALVDSKPDGRSRSWLRFPFVVILMVGLAFLGCWCIGQVAGLVGGLPPKQSITEHPFW